MINSLKKHFFWKHAFSKNGIFSGDLDLAHVNIKYAMRYTYVFLVSIVFLELSSVTFLQNITMVEPIWPMVLFQDFSPSALALAFQSIAILILFLIFYIPENRLLRVLFFIFFFLVTSLNNSFGKINHGLHLAIMLSFFLALIPSNKVKNYKLKSILMFATAQFFLLMAYSLTGFWKLFWGVIEFFTKEVSLFSPLTLRNTIIYQFELSNATVVGSWVLEHQTIGYVFYLFGVFIELFAIVIFFKANMHKLWGVLLIALHIGIKLILGVSSFSSIVVLGLLLVCSPFAKQTSLKDMFFDFPVISQLYWVYNKLCN
jgi:hypothetical protein